MNALYTAMEENNVDVEAPETETEMGIQISEAEPMVCRGNKVITKLSAESVKP